MNIFYLSIVENDILAYLLPSCSNQLLIHDIVSHHPVIFMCHAEFVYFHFVFLIICWCQKCLAKIQNRYVHIFYYFTLAEH